MAPTSTPTPVSDVSASLWRDGDFRQLWLAQTVSQLGTQITFIAVPLIAIRSLDASPLAIGALNALEFAPFVLVGLFAGAVVDRLRRRAVMVAADVARAIVLASIPIAYLLDALTLPLLLVVTVLIASLSVFFDVAYQSYLPSLVSRTQLVDANSKLELSRSAAQVGGAALAGGLIQLLTAPVAVIVDCVSFLGSALAVTAIRKPESSPAEATKEARAMRSTAKDILDGIRLVHRERPLRYLALSSATSNLGLAVVEALVLIYAVRSLRLDIAVIGAIFAAGNFGIAVGALAAKRLVDRVGVGRAILVGAVGQGFGLLLIPLAHSWWAIPILVGAQVIRTGGVVTFNVAQVSLRQAMTPASHLGRVNATMRVLAWSLIPIGALSGGGLGSAIGIRPALLVGATVGALAVVPAMHVSLRRASIG
jgi:MFS family permease